VLPSLPGIPRRTYTANPKLLRDSNGSLGEASNAIDDRSAAALSLFADLDSFEEASVSVMGYPEQGSAFNDINGRYSLRSQQRDRNTKTRSLPFSSLDSVPSFVVDDHRQCRFIAYFTEEVPSNLTEPVRSRRVEISYHVEDNTMEVVEPRVHNSGLLQGKLLRRHHVAKPPSPNDQNPEVSIYTLPDLKAGSQIVIYNITYTIADCDEFTKKLYREMGDDFGEPLPPPRTYYDPTTSRASLGSRRTASEIFSPIVKPFNAETKSFLNLMVLFYVFWRMG